MPLPEGIRGILLDIEGTTTPISFVHDILFPYARSRLEEHCARAAAQPGIREALARLREEHAKESQHAGAALPAFGDGASYTRYLMDRDRKSSGLKQLQGLIWEDGYRSGRLRGQVFDDVPEALRRWRAAGLRLRIFSSGSVLAQKLLFGHTEHGDLTVCFEGYHDTTTGPKKEPRSYREIAQAYELRPEEVLFLSDVVAELDAAAAAGLVTGMLKRPGNVPEEHGGHATYGTFDELL